MKVDVKEQALAEHFQKLAGLLELEFGAEDHFRGILDNVPYLVTAVASDNPVYLFKFRMLEKRDEPDSWVDTLEGGEFGDMDLLCQVEAGYLFLFVYKALQSEPEKIVAVLRKCLADHSEYFPSAPGYCYHCQAPDGGKLIQLSTNVATLCEACVDKVVNKVQEDDRTVNPFAPRRLMYLPAALVVSALAWVLFWYTFDSMIEASGGEMMISMKLMVLVAAIFGFGIGWPVGKLLQSSGIAKRMPGWLIASLTCVLTVLLGEAFYATYIASRMEGDFSLAIIPLLMMVSVMAANGFYLAIKGSFAVATGISIYYLLKPKPIAVEL